MLVEGRITIVKCFLHISKDEQRERLQARIDNPHKRWKFSMGDIAERKLWDDYQRAYEDALTRLQPRCMRHGTSFRRIASGIATCW